MQSNIDPLCTFGRVHQQAARNAHLREARSKARRESVVNAKFLEWRGEVCLMKRPYETKKKNGVAIFLDTAQNDHLIPTRASEKNDAGSRDDAQKK